MNSKSVKLIYFFFGFLVFSTFFLLTLSVGYVLFGALQFQCGSRLRATNEVRRLSLQMQAVEEGGTGQDGEHSQETGLQSPVPRTRSVKVMPCHNISKFKGFVIKTIFSCTIRSDV